MNCVEYGTVNAKAFTHCFSDYVTTKPFYLKTLPVYGIIICIFILAASAGSVGEYTVIVWKENFKLSSLCGETFLS